MPDTNALADDLLRSAARLSRWASRHADLGMPYAQARVLALVDDLGPSRITALAAADDCSQPSMTAHVQRLESDGLVSRTPDPADARATQVELTPGGRSVLDGIRRSRGAALAPVLDTVSPHEGRLRDAVALLGELLEATRAAPSPAPSPQTPSPTPEQP
ncbi:MAG: MarR family transcriptional regulator [Ornithinibacter sp.]